MTQRRIIWFASGGGLAIVALITALAVYIEYAEPVPHETGMLAGNVTVGPVCPVEREGVPCEVPPSVYTSRHIVVRTRDGKTIAEQALRPDGTFAVMLPVGTHILDIKRSGVDTAAGLPMEVEIKKNATTSVNFTIDTGVR